MDNVDDIPYISIFDTTWKENENFSVDNSPWLTNPTGHAMVNPIHRQENAMELVYKDDDIQIAFSNGFAGLNEENKKLALDIIAGIKAKQDFENK